MGEWKLVEGAIPHVSTAEFHADRERAPHLEQEAHRPRLLTAANIITGVAALANVRGDAPVTVSDLGCGDGGLLSLLPEQVEAWGYDFQPTNVAGWVERGVQAESLDVFGADRDRVRLGTVAVTTEVLEHLADPHGVVRWIGEHSRYLVASSPWIERLGSHDECHAWAWDQRGYAALLAQGGFRVLRHELVGPFQVVLGMRV